ncbi:unnamed protein product [Ranitomeya imitator]|uniref:Ig-like domain-containing protein n=1 Tax=Ranitomeya imitator TaxID=111125 RepID=A0ABN9KXD1_9NEOB|nr:unnamed protein product [Ranitomeya imitator]
MEDGKWNSKERGHMFAVSLPGLLNTSGSDSEDYQITVLQACSAQKITRFTACLMGRGPTLRLDCRYMNITNNDLRYEFRLKRRKEPEIILSTINLNKFNDKYHNRASVYRERGLVQLHIQRYNTSDLGEYTCTLNIPEDLTINQTVSINVSKDFREKKDRAVGFQNV